MDANLDRIPEHIIDPLCLALGRFMFNWGFIDSGVTQTVFITYHYVGGAIISKEIPRNWRPRIKYLGQCFNKLPELEPHALRAEYMIGLAKKIERIRTFVAHGTLREYHEDKDHLLVFGKLDTENGYKSHKDETIGITANALASYVNTSHQLATELVEFNKRLFKEFASQ